MLVAAAIGALSAAGFAQWRKRKIGALGFLAGLTITFVGAINLANGGIDAPDFMDTSPEPGLYMVLIAGVLLAVSAGYLTFKRQSSKSVAESDGSSGDMMTGRSGRRQLRVRRPTLGRRTPCGGPRSNRQDWVRLGIRATLRFGPRLSAEELALRYWYRAHRRPESPF